MASEPTAAVRRPVYSSFFSLVSLLVSCGATYATVAFYRDGASEELKYGGLVSAIAALVLSCVLLHRSLTKSDLTIWRLQSVKVCIAASIIQTIFGVIFLWAVFHLGFTNVLSQRPIIYTAITCVIAIHGYMLYANIRQTHLIFLSLTIGALELIASIGIVVVALLYVLSRNKKVKGSNGDSSARTGQSTIGGPGTFEAIAMLDGLPTKVRVEASDPALAARMLEAQYGKSAFEGGRAFAHKV